MHSSPGSTERRGSSVWGDRVRVCPSRKEAATKEGSSTCQRSREKNNQREKKGKDGI